MVSPYLRDMADKPQFYGNDGRFPLFKRNIRQMLKQWYRDVAKDTFNQRLRSKICNKGLINLLSSVSGMMRNTSKPIPANANGSSQVSIKEYIRPSCGVFG
jgi:hypothetical protein